MSEQESGDVRTPPIPFPFRRPTTEGRQFKGPVLTAMGIDRRLREMAPLPREGWDRGGLGAGNRCGDCAPARGTGLEPNRTGGDGWV